MITLSIASSFAASWVLTHVIVLLIDDTQLVSVHETSRLTNPASLPPAVTVTRFVVVLLSAATCVLITSVVNAPVHAWKFNV